MTNSLSSATTNCALVGNDENHCDVYKWRKLRTKVREQPKEVLEHNESSKIASNEKNQGPIRRNCCGHLCEQLFHLTSFLKRIVVIKLTKVWCIEVFTSSVVRFKNDGKSLHQLFCQTLYGSVIRFSLESFPQTFPFRIFQLLIKAK